MAGEPAESTTELKGALEITAKISSSDTRVEPAEPTPKTASENSQQDRGANGGELDNGTGVTRVNDLHAKVAATLPGAADWTVRLNRAITQLRVRYTTASTSGEPPSTTPKLTSMIATVPDPIDSGLGYQFETALQALHRGIEHHIDPDSKDGDKLSFYRDRSWLPWDDRDVSSEQHRQSEDCRMTTPGIMLFRDSDWKNPEVFALFLVGESPTSGLNQTTMRNALRIAERFDSGNKDSKISPKVPTIRIIGPSYSGSAQSLYLALRSWALDKGPLHFRVRSGTATGAFVPDWLGKAHVPIKLTASSDISFDATTVPEAVAECSYFWFLHNRLHVTEDPVIGTHDSKNKRTALAGVATLTESGTEFGTHEEPRSAYYCHWKASSEFHFPYHVSALRDAYEDLDRRESQAHNDMSVSRATALTASLREVRAPLDAEANPSEKTRTAQDIALGSVIEQLLSRDVRHLAIHATDVGDAIFLARKIRDVAPDVRLAFFDTDALLLHSAFRRDLMGSLVVSPYPFLGLNEYTARFGTDKTDSETGATKFDGFATSNMEGIYNATVAQRADGILTDEKILSSLSNYRMGSKLPLPVWISTIGRGSFVPLSVTPTADCERTVFGTSKIMKAVTNAYCEAASKKPVQPKSGDGASEGTRRKAREEFTRKSAQDLSLGPDRSLPYVWHLLFVVLIGAFLVDSRCQKTAERQFSLVPFPEVVIGFNDQAIDRAIGRTKWRLFRTIRSLLFTLALAYLSALCLLWHSSSGELVHIWRHRHYGMLTCHVSWLFCCAIALLLSVRFTIWAFREYHEDYKKFANNAHPPTNRASGVDVTTTVAHIVELLCGLARRFPFSKSSARAPSSRRSDSTAPSRAALDGSAPETPTAEDTAQHANDDERRISRDPDSNRPSSWPQIAERISQFFGTAVPVGRLQVVRMSLRQLRTLYWSMSAVAVLFVALLTIDTLQSTERHWSGTIRPGATLAVLRNAALTSGVSPAVPTLLCLACVYLCVVGCMARLALAHTLSRSSPPDGETDLVSTPIRLILYPRYKPQVKDQSNARDAGFTEVERRVLNAIWRPIAGHYTVAAALVVLLAPCAVLWLKPLATLESRSGTWLLRSGLSLSAFLIGVTVVELVQYWRALHRLLKRTMEHPLGPAFRSIPAFARDSIDHQVSHTPDDDLRWAGAARLFCDLVRSLPATQELVATKERQEDLAQRRTRLDAARNDSLAAGRDATREAALAEGVISAASSVTELLDDAWTANARTARSALPRLNAQAIPVQDYTQVAARPLSDAIQDALTAAESSFAPIQLEWLRSAQAFVATVVTLLIHRHVRQFRYFLHVTTGGALLLLLAVTSYPFEPYRLLLTFIWITVGAVVIANFWIFIQLDRNTLMSHISGTTPHSMTLDGAFAFRVLAWGIVPLLSVAAAQYPEVANVLSDILSPLGRALR